MNRLLKIILVVLAIGATSYAGACVYANVIGFKAADAKTAILPPVSEARYVVTLAANDNALLCNNYETFGTKPGQRTFVLHGYWESVGQDFKFRNRDMYLDERIYGAIAIVDRPKPTPTPTGSSTLKAGGGR